MFIDESFSPRNPSEAAQLESLKRMLSEWNIGLRANTEELRPISNDLAEEITSQSLDINEEKEDEIEENIANRK